MHTQATVASVLLFFGLCGSAAAATVYDESVLGDLSDSNLLPTAIALNNGANSIIGSINNSPLDRDFFTFDIGAGQSLTGFVLEQYDSTEDQSFLAIQSGPGISSLTDASALLGSALVGAFAGAQAGDDVLDDLGAAFPGGAGFSGPLGPGTYTVWFQEVSAPVDYTFNLQVVPIPAAIWLMLSGLLGLAALGKSRAPKA